jgi:isoquinoline 1-oxidoreductase beta subunit
MSQINNVSRRRFLQATFGTGALVLAARYLPPLLMHRHATGGQTDADRATLNPNLFVGIQRDGTVYLVAHRSEMGTVIRTSLPLVLADELDADWKRVKIDQAIGDMRYGDQNTDGSHSIRSFFDTLRQCGAAARWMLLQAAAEQWNVPASECSTEAHTVVHQASGRRLGYGELAAEAARLTVPKKEQLQLKMPAEWRYIGKEVTSVDLEKLCTGTAMYGMDARLEGMVYASVEHPPVFGGKIKTLDHQEALKVAGVHQIASIDPFKPPAAFQPLGGVAVIADNTWAAFQGRKKLKITWDNGPNESYDSVEYRKELKETAHKPGKLIRSVGDTEKMFPTRENVLQADYYVPLLAHVPMEPMVALAEFKDGRVTAWAPTQNPQAVQAIVSSELGIPIEDVVCHVTLLGGGFGRKSKPDYVAEAAVLSKKLGRPVKVVWTREDDVRFDYYNAVAAMYMQAAVDVVAEISLPADQLDLRCECGVWGSAAPGTGLDGSSL